MMKFPVILRATAASLVAVCVTSTARAALVDDFSTGGGGLGYTLGGGPGPSVITGAPDGDYLRLLNGVASESNHYSFSTSDFGAFETISATFDFRITPGSAGLADGFHFMLIPTATYGPVGDGPNPTAEAPNAPGSFGIGFDVHPTINTVRPHWDNAERYSFNVPTAAPGVNFRGNNVFNRAQIDLQRVGNGTNVTLTLTSDSLGTTPGTPYKAFEITMPNMLPYENRVQFGGRTGGQNLNLDLDNVNVTYANEFLGLANVAPTGHLYQDFDSSGTTSYRAVQINGRTDTVFRPGPLINAGDAGSDGAFMRIVNDAVEGQSNHISFDRAFDGGLGNTKEVLDFDVRINSLDGPADGLGVLFLPTATHGIAGNGPGSSEEPNLAGVLGVGFDVYQNAGEAAVPSISLHWNGAIVGSEVTIADPSVNITAFHHMQIIRETVPGGLNVSVIFTADVNGIPGIPLTVLDNVFVAGASNYDHRVQFSARTGGANADHDIDNVIGSQQTIAQVDRSATDFSNGNGAGYKAFRLDQGNAPRILTDTVPGINGEYLRLVNDGSNNQRNSLVFDKQLSGSIDGKTSITADFDFRIINDPAAAAADGFSLILLPTASFGDSGPGGLAMIAAEEPNIAGAFGLGFDLYLDGVTPFNEVSLHWNGVTFYATDLQTTLIDLDSGVFHRAQLTLDETGTDTIATLTLTPDIFGVPGTPVTVFDQVLLSGMEFYDFRTEFAARTGGANMTVDLDNISIGAVPEPTSAVLALAGLAVFATRRRRS